MKTHRIPIYRTLIFAAAVCVASSSCSTSRTEPKPADLPVHQFKNYSFDASSPIRTRIRRVPDFILDFYTKLDKGKNYRAYEPGDRDLRLADNTLSKIPKFLQRLLKERLLGIYFIANLNSSALTDWVVKDDGKIYIYMIFNPRCLNETLSQTLTYKENTCFRPDDPEMRLSVDCGPDESGFLYVLLHESVHAADYCCSVSPYVEPDTKILQKKSASTGRIVEGIWKDYKIPVEDHPLRKKITFYGARKGPLLALSEATDAYTWLSSSPFASLYGSLDWSEDLAELAAFDYITHILGRPYKILIKKNDKIIFSQEPFKKLKLKKRIPGLRKHLEQAIRDLR